MVVQFPDQFGLTQNNDIPVSLTVDSNIELNKLDSHHFQSKLIIIVSYALDSAHEKFDVCNKVAP